MQLRTWDHPEGAVVFQHACKMGLEASWGRATGLVWTIARMAQIEEPGPPLRRGGRGLEDGKMPVADDPLWKDWLTAEKTLGEARDQLRTVEHLDLGHREFQEAWQAYRLALEVFNAKTNKL